MKEAAKLALVRAVRTAVQTAAACVVALPTVSAVADIRAVADPAVVGIYVTACAFVASFLQNFAEGIKDPE